MVDENEMGGKVFIASERSRSELADLIVGPLAARVSASLGELTIHTTYGDLDLRRNKECNRKRAEDFPDGFLFFDSILEFYPQPSAGRGELVSLTATILSSLWSLGIPAVAACDFEDEFPNSGGYSQPGLPWPSGAVATAGFGRAAAGGPG